MKRSPGSSRPALSLPVDPPCGRNLILSQAEKSCRSTYKLVLELKNAVKFVDNATPLGPGESVERATRELHRAFGVTVRVS